MSSSCFLAVLLLYSVACFSCQEESTYSQKLIRYTISVIEYLAKDTFETFVCVFYDLQAANPFDNVLGEVLRSSRLDHVVKLLINESFMLKSVDDLLDPLLVPSLVIVHADNRLDLGKEVESVLEAIPSGTNVIVLVNVLLEDHFVETARLFVGKGFHMIVYLGTTGEFVLRFDINLHLLPVPDTFPHPKNLLVSAARNLKGRDVRYTGMFLARGRISSTVEPYIQWVRETAYMLNGTPCLVTSPCSVRTSDFLECVFEHMNRFDIDIVLDGSFFVGDISRIPLIYNLHPMTEILVIPKGREFNFIEIFMAPLTTETWIVLAALMIAVEVINLLFPQVFRNEPILLVICGLERFNLHRAGRWEKTILLSLTLFCFLMSNAYETKLISLMTLKPSHEIDSTIQEVVESGLGIKANLKAYPTLIHDPQIGSMLIHSTDDISEMDGIHGYVAIRHIAQFYLPVYHHYHSHKYVILNDPLGMYICSFLLSYRNPLQRILQESLSWYIESGIYGTVVAKYATKFEEWTVRQKRMNRTTNEEDIAGLLGIDDLIPAWLSLAAGVTLAVMILIGEVVVKWCVERSYKSRVVNIY